MGRTLGVILNLKDKFSTTLQNVGKNTKSFTAKLNQANKFTEKIEKNIMKVGKAATAFGAISIGTGIKSFSDYDSAVKQAAASTGTSLKDMKQLKSVIKNVYGSNYGENWEDVANSVSTVQKYLGGTGKSVEEAAKNALVLRDTFGTDVTESMRSVDALMKNFGISSKEAFNLIGQAAQQNLDFSGELVDSINEYSSQVKKLGLSAEDMFAIFASGAENGAWNIDKIGDALKEFSIRSIDGSKTTQQGFTAIGKNANEMAQKFSVGGETAKNAFFETIQCLKNMDDAVAQDAAGVALFGTMWEDLGKDVVLNMDKMGGAFDKNRQTMQQINQIKYSSFSKAVTGIGRQLSVAFLPIGETILPYLNQFANFLSNKLPKAVEAFTNILPHYIDNIVANIKSAFYGLSKVFSFLKNHIQELKAVVAGLAAAFIALKTTTAVGKVFKAIPKEGSAVKLIFNTLKKSLLANPFILVAAAIGVLVGAFVLLYQKSETFRTIIQAVWSKLKSFVAIISSSVISVLQKFHSWFSEKIIPILSQAIQIFMLLWTKLKGFAASISNSVISTLQQLYSWFNEKIAPILLQIGQNFVSLWTKLKEFAVVISSPIISALQLLYSWFSEKIAPILLKIGQVFISLLQIMQPFSVWITDVFVSGVGIAFQNFFTVINAVLPHVQGVIEGLLTVFNGVLIFLNGVFAGDWAKAWQGMKDIFSGIVQSIKSIFLGVIEVIKGRINGITSQINNVAQKMSSLPIIGGIAQKINIPQFATGTQYFNGGTALVGEHGAELVNMPSGSKITPADKTKQLLKSGNTVNVHITVQGNVIGNEQYANQLGSIIVQKVLAAQGNI